MFHRLLGAANARPDGYNIVLQGDVTSLAKMTANERRKVLDNVAGVTSYDDEIRKATKQKDMVENYLDRIGLLEKEELERLSTLAKERRPWREALVGENRCAKPRADVATFCTAGLVMKAFTPSRTPTVTATPRIDWKRRVATAGRRMGGLMKALAVRRQRLEAARVQGGLSHCGEAAFA